MFIEWLHKYEYAIEMNFSVGIQKHVSDMKFKNSVGVQSSTSERGIKRCRSLNTFIENEDFNSSKDDIHEHVSKFICQDDKYGHAFETESGDIRSEFLEYNEDVYEFDERELLSNQKDIVGTDKEYMTSASFRGRKRNNSYGLRPRCGIKKSTFVEGEKESQSAPPKMITRGSSKQRGIGRRKRTGNSPKSKYRRNTANERERDRMKEINVAFAALRAALPPFACRRVPAMTKMKTLKLASSYIQALSDVLADSPAGDSKRLLSLQFLNEISDNGEILNEISDNREIGFDTENKYLNNNESLLVYDASKSSSNNSVDINEKTRHNSNFSALKSALSVPLKNSVNSHRENIFETNSYEKKSFDNKILTEKTHMFAKFKQKTLLNSKKDNLSNHDNTSILNLNTTGNYDCNMNIISTSSHHAINSEHFQTTTRKHLNSPRMDRNSFKYVKGGAVLSPQSCNYTHKESPHNPSSPGHNEFPASLTNATQLMNSQPDSKVCENQVVSPQSCNYTHKESPYNPSSPGHNEFTALLTNATQLMNTQPVSQVCENELLDNTFASLLSDGDSKDRLAFIMDSTNKNDDWFEHKMLLHC